MESPCLKEALMAITIAGVVKDGVVVPQSPLPEGAAVEILLTQESPEVPPELQEELAAWQQASANALALVERLAHHN
jgi:hypothetical protein